MTPALRHAAEVFCNSSMAIRLHRENNIMPNELKTLLEFLDRFSAEVEGRSLEQPPDEVKSKLRDFARGQLTEPQRGELIGQLKEHPDWMALLANEARSLRPAAQRQGPA